MDAVETLNRTIFLALNATPATPHWLIASGTLIADYAILLVPAMLVALWLTGADERRALAVRACFAGLLALGINQLIGLAWYHPRPFVSATGHTFLAHAPDSSFPSDHVTLLSAVSFTFLYGGKRGVGLLALIVDVAVAWARIFVGVHWPFDMIGAAIVAWLACVVGSPFWRLAGMAVTRALIALYRKVLAVPIGLRWLRS
ncbi:phosphatase PAP2 family protein [Paraburkholderia sp. CNPSo 3274]|uniref:phosphatase PAP2 family protein n=1 Tax=Paraburkholderia sp. CNPSo 3274 TaxID=2940932 RepID=UPI0020B676D9|nr:phosphatase PAP2 family protein [Paraburkholderia sp. CNPSo 3274]MCP3707737.1 phosphatase PAP2 family protein [Paraburkholderia sp. CNPSo 3274]